MTFDINDTSPRDQYTASAAQTVFTISFEFLEDADIKAYLTPTGSDPDDTADILVLTTDFTLVGAGSNGTKELTLVVAATAGDVITIVRDAGVDRDTEFLSNGDLDIASMNQELNKIITLIQQVEMNQEQRSLMFMRAAQLAGVSLELPAPVADSALVWNSTGTAIENQDADTFGGGNTATAVAAAASATASASAAASSATDAENFMDERYLGPKSSAPALDNDGGALTAGALYFNTTTDDLWFYTGSAWQLYNSSAASSANTVSLSDSAGYYTGTNLEAALAEMSGVHLDSLVFVSGTTAELTGIPVWANKIIITLEGVSLGSAGEEIILQVGTGAAWSVVGYTGGYAVPASSADGSIANGFLASLAANQVAASQVYGNLTMTRRSDASNAWVIAGNLWSTSDGTFYNVAGQIGLAAALTRLRLNTTGGTAAFDNGVISMNCMR